MLKVILRKYHYTYRFMITNSIIIALVFWLPTPLATSVLDGSTVQEKGRVFECLFSQTLVTALVVCIGVNPP